MSTAPTAAGTAHPSRRTGTYYAMSVSFQFVAGTTAGTHDDLMSVELVTLINSGNNAFVVAEKAWFADRRDTTAAGFTTGQMAVYENVDAGILPYHAELGGALLDTSKLNGHAVSSQFDGTLIRSYQLAAYDVHSHDDDAPITSCTPTASTDSFSATAVSDHCHIAYDASAATQPPTPPSPTAVGSRLCRFFSDTSISIFALASLSSRSRKRSRRINSSTTGPLLS